jgi:hypothetical protein
MDAAPQTPAAVDQQSGRWGPWLLATALLSAVGLMTPVWSAGPLALDEHVSYWIIDAEQPGNVWSRTLNFAATPPLSSWVQQACIAIGGKTEAMLRLPSVLGYLAAVVLIYFVGQSLRGPTTGGLAALILTWHPAVVDEVRIGRCYGLLLALCTLLLGTTLWWRGRSESLVRAGVWAIVAAAVFWTHYLGALLITASWLTILWPRPPAMKRGWQPVIAAILGGVMTAVACSPLLPAVERLSAWSPMLNYQSGTTSLGTLFGPFWWLGLPVATAVTGLVKRRLRTGPCLRSRRERFLRVMAAPVWLPVLWSVLPLLTLSIIAHGDLSSLANPRYRVPYAVGGACVMALLVSAQRYPRIAILGVTLGLIAMWSVSDTRPWQLVRLADAAASDWQQIGTIIESRGQVGEPVFVQSGLVESNLVPALCADEPFLEYVACRAGRFYLPSAHPRCGLPWLWAASTDVVECFRQRIARETAGGQRIVWLACATDSDLNRGSAEGMQQLLAEVGFVPTQEWPFATAILQRWELRRER